MKTCPKCGNVIHNDNARFCKECGTDLYGKNDGGIWLGDPQKDSTPSTSSTPENISLILGSMLSTEGASLLNFTIMLCFM